MKLQAFIVSALALFSVVAAPAAETPWEGLWKISQQTPNGLEEFSVFIPGSGGSAVFYGPDWLTLPVAEFRAEGGDFLLNWQAKGTNVVFEGSRSGDRISGKWVLLHPQYHEEGKFSARKVLDVASWSPLAEAPSGTVADLNARLAEHASDLDDFWNRTFKSGYWVFLDADADPGRVRERLKDPDFASASARLAAALEETAKLFPSKLDGFKLPGPVVLLPFGPPDEFRLRFVQDKSFLLLNPVRLLTRSESSREALARRLLSALAGVRFVGRHASVALLRAGLPPHGLLGLGLAKDEREALGLGVAEWKAEHGRLDQIKKKIAGGRPLNSAETAVAGLDFVSFLARGQSFVEILNSPPAKLDRELARYLSPTPEVKP